tara:strand:+ start:2538 stop:2921 length:384 start_codon:yes stop_codon:yes gene_type:complete
VSIPTIAVQKAVYQRLSQSLSVPVYDDVPADATYPYVTLDRVDVHANDYVNHQRDERFIYLNVWSNYRGQKEVLDILSAIHNAMHDARLSLEAGALISCRVIRQNTHRDSDGVTYQGSLTLRIQTAH